MVGKVNRNFLPFKKGDLVRVHPGGGKGEVYVTDYKQFVPMSSCFEGDVDILDAENRKEAIDSLFTPILPPVQLFGGDG